MDKKNIVKEILENGVLFKECAKDKYYLIGYAFSGDWISGLEVINSDESKCDTSMNISIDDYGVVVFNYPKGFCDTPYAVVNMQGGRCGFIEPLITLENMDGKKAEVSPSFNYNRKYAFRKALFSIKDWDWSPKIVHLPKHRLVIKEENKTENKSSSEKVKKNYKTYLMIDWSLGCIKIGKSLHPKVRERTLLAERPSLELVAINEHNIEKSLHNKYKSKRLRGEWFSLSFDEFNEILNKGFILCAGINLGLIKSSIDK